MQLAVAVMLLVMFSLPHLARAQQQSYWADCGADADCAVIDGPCAPASVNKGYESVASAYFGGRAKKEKCVKQFWQLKREDAAARCYMERCEIIAKEK